MTLPAQSQISVALLTGGGDRPYAFGLATALMAQGISLDIVAGDELDSPEFHDTPGVTFLNLRGNQDPDVSFSNKMSRVLLYYWRLIRYALFARPKVFHILWNNKFETIDRTALMLYYKALGKRVVLTAHNVNAGRRDADDTFFNRLTLKAQYLLADHIFVHTDKMKGELVGDFGVRDSAVTVIPFGVNNAVPDTDLSTAEARRRLGMAAADRVVLFFGTIAPYKGLEYLVTAFQQLLAESTDYRLIVAGRPRKGCEEYWSAIRRSIGTMARARVIHKIEHIPDQDTEVYFKAADVLVLPYTEVFQSGVLFLGYRFGLPAIVADVGSLSSDIIEGRTGYSFVARDASDLARVVKTYFASDLFKGLPSRRLQIRDFVHEQHSWAGVGRITKTVYQSLLGNQGQRGRRLESATPLG
jgi:D-inositol-3-phosphate glycosyltransferase